MDEQRVAIKFCFKAGLSETETPVLVQKAYWTEALNTIKLFRWYIIYNKPTRCNSGSIVFIKNYK